jgi:hypothetical protein
LDAKKMHADDFRGMEAELLMCKGARILLTQNLWVEAGLMNGALGIVKGFAWPEDADAQSEQVEKRTPLCVLVEFDSVNLVTPAGDRRSFFPGDAEKTNWVPIFRQQVSSTLEDNVYREQYPLTLAWALTHWKAQGMTLDRVRVHLSDRTAGVPGIAFVAMTRVRHPWDLVFEEDHPAYEHFMKARKTPAFRERQRFELRQRARASRTLRKYGFCEADVWIAQEREEAGVLLKGLDVVRAQQKESLRNAGRPVDADAWLWPEGEPDYVETMAAVVTQVAAGDAQRRLSLEAVAERLLDVIRVRQTTAEENVLGERLLAVVGGFDCWRGNSGGLSAALESKVLPLTAGESGDILHVYRC